METDPASLDPEVRTAKILSLGSVSLGLMSLCGALLPICGGVMSLLGIVLGMYAMKTEESKTALAGVLISGLGLLLSLSYTLFLFFFGGG